MASEQVDFSSSVVSYKYVNMELSYQDSYFFHDASLIRVHIVYSMKKSCLKCL